MPKKTTTANTTKLFNGLSATTLISGALVAVGSFLSWNHMLSVSFGWLDAYGIDSTAGKITLASGIAIIALAVIQWYLRTSKKVPAYLIPTGLFLIATIVVSIMSYQWKFLHDGSSDIVHTSPSTGVYVIAIGALLVCAIQLYIVIQSKHMLLIWLLPTLLVLAFLGGVRQSHNYLVQNDPNGFDDSMTTPMPDQSQSNEPIVIEDK